MPKVSYDAVPPLISIVIPVRNDAESLARLLAQLSEGGPSVPRAESRGVPPSDVEIIISTVGDDDQEIRALSLQRTDLTWVHSTAGRAAQLNAGAAQATGEWLWFVHADSVLPDGWLEAFRRLDQTGDRQPETGNRNHNPTGDRQPATGNRNPIPTGDRQPATGNRIVGGSFRFALSSPAWQARLIERGVASRVRWLNLPYGDQGIFVRRQVFLAMNGFAPLPLLEDVELIGRLKRLGALRHLTLSLTTSARRWERDGWWRRSVGNLAIVSLYWLGVSPERLARRYYRERGHASRRPRCL